MEPMSLVLLFIFSMLFAMGFNYGFPKVLSYPALQKYQTSYAGKTLITAGSVFVLLIVVSWVMSFAYRKPSLPSA
jgi:hypothetical protein